MTDQADGEKRITTDSNRERSSPHPTQDLEDHVPRRYILNMSQWIYFMIEKIVPGKYN
jgi:hypothetical protein